MKFRKNKIKREHSIIVGALNWLEDLSKKREVTDIIPGVIDVTNTPGKGIVYKYETPTGCKLLLKSGGSIQEAFIVTPNPQVVQDWVKNITAELSLLEAAADDKEAMKKSMEDKESFPSKKSRRKTSSLDKKTKSSTIKEEDLLRKRDELLIGIQEDYRLVEINKGLRDSYVESLASMADLDDPTIVEVINPSVRNALENLHEALQAQKQESKKPSSF